MIYTLQALSWLCIGALLLAGCDNTKCGIARNESNAAIRASKELRLRAVDDKSIILSEEWDENTRRLDRAALKRELACGE